MMQGYFKWSSTEYVDDAQVRKHIHGGIAPALFVYGPDNTKDILPLVRLEPGILVCNKTVENQQVIITLNPFTPADLIEIDSGGLYYSGCPEANKKSSIEIPQFICNSFEELQQWLITKYPALAGKETCSDSGITKYIINPSRFSFGSI